MNHLFKTFRSLLIIAIVLFSVKSLQAQDTTYIDVLDFFETNTVSWVNQIPLLKEDAKQENKGWFKRLLFGKSDLTGLQKPVGIIGIDPKNCIVFDQGNGTIFIANDNKLEIPKSLRKKETYFPSLVGACMLPDKRILFTDSKLNKIFTLSEDKKQITVLNNNLKLDQPTGIAFNKRNNEIWVLETALHRISILDAFGQPLKTIGTRGTNEAEFNYPTSIWIDHNGLVYVVDALNYRVQIFDAEGNFKLIVEIPKPLVLAMIFIQLTNPKIFSIIFAV